MMKPCLDCGTPANGNRCPQHAAQRRAVLQKGQNIRRANQPGRSKYTGAYAKAGGQVRATATRCWLCNAGPIKDDPWQADHIQQGGRTTGGTDLAPAHRSCNIRRRHLAGKGWNHQRIVERLQLLRHGPPNNPTTNPQPTPHPHGAEGQQTHPGPKLHGGA